MNRERKSALVPEKDKQVEEDLWQRYGAEREVWTQPMLIALERGIKGNKWFSLIDKVRSERGAMALPFPTGGLLPTAR